MNDDTTEKLVDALNRLGSESDADILVAARDVHRLAGELNIDWAAAIGETVAPSDEPAPAFEPAAETGDAAALIDRLLQDQALGTDTREDLEAMRADIADGAFTEADRKYLQNLAERLGRN